MALVHTIPETTVTVPTVLRNASNGDLPADWLRSFDGTTRDDYKMFAPVSYAMQAMILAALADGVELTTTGRYRTYRQQDNLFRSRFTRTFDAALNKVPQVVRYWLGVAWYILRGVALAAVPGTSNHGLAIADDICHPGFVSLSQAGLQWLKDNAASFGFALDMHAEPWHWHWHNHDALTQRTVDVLAAAGVQIEDLSRFGFTVPTTPTNSPEEDDMFTDQDRRLLVETHAALRIDGAVMPGYPSIFTMVNQIRSIVVGAFGDGFPGSASFGWALRTLRRLAAHFGISTT